MVQAKPNLEKKAVRRYVVVGSRRGSNFVYACLSFLASLGFFALPIGCMGLGFTFMQSDVCQNAVWPQGLVLIFYGFIALGFCAYLTFIIILNIGSGWNIFDAQNQYVRIFRWGFPGKNRRIDLTYGFDSIVAIDVQKNTSGAQLYLALKDQRQIPFCSSVPMGFEPMEALATDLALFLQKEVRILT